MKLNDKVKEFTDNWTEWANCYSEINKELELKNPNSERVIELFQKRDKLTSKRETILHEIQVLVNKTAEDIKLKIDRLYSSKA